MLLKMHFQGGYVQIFFIFSFFDNPHFFLNVESATPDKEILKCNIFMLIHQTLLWKLLTSVCKACKTKSMGRYSCHHKYVIVEVLQ